MITFCQTDENVIYYRHYYVRLNFNRRTIWRSLKKFKARISIQKNSISRKTLSISINTLYFFFQHSVVYQNAR
ncbi:hypothetical protein PUN28_007797 [Cardiocondyla obscurior]|uniref:Uncharacterized protein n=1 Tax=Cardiocondyla obscurior TaxID=286306 RepID=A0AAW2FWE7_9HYME